MPLSAAERQRLRRQRIRENPELHDAIKQKERQRWHKRNQEGKVRTVDELSEREKRSRRKKWRLAQTRCRRRNQEMNDIIPLTPPTSPLGELSDGEPSRRQLQGLKRRKKAADKRRRSIRRLEEALQKERQKKRKSTGRDGND